jgi:hypothetical protein
MLFEILDPGLWRVGRMEEEAVLNRLLVSNHLKRVLGKAIARVPSKRFQSALEFQVALEEAIEKTQSDFVGFEQEMFRSNYD